MFHVANLWEVLSHVVDALAFLAWVILLVVYRNFKYHHDVRHSRKHGAFVVGDMVGYHDKEFHRQNCMLHIYDVSYNEGECMYSGQLYQTRDDGNIATFGLLMHVGESRLQRLTVIQSIPKVLP